MKSNFQAHDFPLLWASYINKGKLEQVIELYHENSRLMPTFSPHVVKNKQGLIDYFTQLSSREDLHVNLHDKSVYCLHIANECYVINGLYSFEFKVDDTLLTFPSRFSFVIDLSLDNPILHHQSSQIPRTLT